MFTPKTCADDYGLRCISCGSVAAFYNDEAEVFYCDACATLLAEKIITAFMSYYLLVSTGTSLPQ